MKTIKTKARFFSIFFTIALTASQGACNLIAQNNNSSSDSFQRVVVTAAQYCDFLNVIALNDRNFLYDEKMGSDLGVASIVRLGDPGSYSYCVIAGRESTPVTYVSSFTKASYCGWFGDEDESEHEGVSRDLFLRSNRMLSIVNQPCNGQLLMLLPANMTSPQFRQNAETAGEIILGTIIGAFVLRIIYLQVNSCRLQSVMRAKLRNMDPLKLMPAEPTQRQLEQQKANSNLRNVLEKNGHPPLSSEVSCWARLKYKLGRCWRGFFSPATAVGEN